MLRYLIFSSLLMASTVIAHAETQGPPLDIPEWLNAQCRYRIVADLGAYGNDNDYIVASTFERCVALAQASMVSMENSSDASEKPLFHRQGEVIFTPKTGKARHCTLDSKKPIYDFVSRDIFAIEFLGNSGSPEPVASELKNVLDANIEVTCDLEASS